MRSLSTAAATVAFTVLLVSAAAAQPTGPKGNLDLAPDVLQKRLRDEPIEIVDVAGTTGGITETAKVKVRFPSDGFSTEAKWKRAPDSGDSWNNSPRREIGAYQIQQLMFAPKEYLVPPVAPRCIGLETYRPIAADATPNVPNAKCVYGVLSAWIHNVKTADPPLDPERFSHDLPYACRFGTLNVFLYLIAHRDARSANLLISTDPANPEIFSIDNGIAFGGTLYNFFAWHFDRIAVQGLPKDAIERVRRIDPNDFQRLGVLGELRLGPDGVLHSVPPSANADPTIGERTLPDGIQFGLTAEEIQGVVARRQELLDRIDRGEFKTFDCPAPSAPRA